MPPTINAQPTTTGVKRWDWISPPKMPPTRTTGMVPITRPMSRFGLPDLGWTAVRAVFQSSRPYSARIAAIEPAWMKISNTMTFASPPMACSKSMRRPATMRCPLDEIGRNSVMPWTRPRTRMAIRSGAVIAGLKTKDRARRCGRGDLCGNGLSASCRRRWRCRRVPPRCGGVGCIWQRDRCGRGSRF